MTIELTLPAPPARVRQAILKLPRHQRGRVSVGHGHILELCISQVADAGVKHWHPSSTSQETCGRESEHQTLRHPLSTLQTIVVSLDGDVVTINTLVSGGHCHCTASGRGINWQVPHVIDGLIDGSSHLSCGVLGTDVNRYMLASNVEVDGACLSGRSGHRDGPSGSSGTHRFRDTHTPNFICEVVGKERLEHSSQLRALAILVIGLGLSAHWSSHVECS